MTTATPSRSPSTTGSPRTGDASGGGPGLQAETAVMDGADAPSGGRRGARAFLPGAPPQASERLRSFFSARPTVGAGAAAKAVAEDASALVRAEIDLAKAELREGIRGKAAGASAFAVAGVFGWLGLQGLLITLGFVLAIWLPDWAAALIVTVLLLAGAGAAALVGKRKFATKVSLDTTKHNVEEDVEWAKAHLPKR